VGDVASMAGYAIALLGDDAALARMAQACRDVASARFCTTKIIPQYEEFYRRVLARSS
jgi:hypothetical protein